MLFNNFSFIVQLFLKWRIRTSAYAAIWAIPFHPYSYLSILADDNANNVADALLMPYCNFASWFYHRLSLLLTITTRFYYTRYYSNRFLRKCNRSHGGRVISLNINMDPWHIFKILLNQLKPVSNQQFIAFFEAFVCSNIHNDEVCGI